jgi:EAL domain-containing protein (putative c-di-GMP-specific phosphodiesterase class I)/CheY-like chemotaxis protein
MDHTTKTFLAPTVATTRHRILLVEDEVDLARVLTRMLEQAGHEVIHAPDGVIASEALTTKSFDLVLSDISLPGITGVELLRLVRTYDLDVPVILMTAHPTVETATEAVELGALQYLAKPVPLDKIRTAVSRGLTLGQLARAKREALAAREGGSWRLGDRAGLIVSFDRAMERIRLVFQPIVDTKARTIFAYEVLLRSSEPSLPDPGAVLDAAERLDAVHTLGRHIRLLASRALKALPSPEALLFVNLHSHELSDPELYGDDAPLASEAKRVVLEVTERASLEGLKDLTSRVRRLRNSGYRIALDDLGAGYAGLTTFTVLEPEIVKLDMSLVRGIGQSVTKQRVVGSIIHLCRELSMRVVAEGVETREELACVSELGCDLLQGYYLGRPADVPVAEVRFP